jgi:hypothetical protein
MTERVRCFRSRHFNWIRIYPADGPAKRFDPLERSVEVTEWTIQDCLDVETIELPTSAVLDIFQAADWPEAQAELRAMTCPTCHGDGEVTECGEVLDCPTCDQPAPPAGVPVGEVLDSNKYDFKTCPTCAAKPGSPILCKSCLNNRRLIGRLREVCKSNISHHNKFIASLRALGLPEGADVAEWVASLNQQVDGWQRTMRNLIRSTGETPSDVAKKAAVAILETLARWKSAMGEAGRLNFYVNVPLDSDQLAKIIDAHFTLLFEQHKQALHAAEARAREAEGERETYRRAWIRSAEHITALQAESAALAERIRGIPLPYAVVPLNDAFQAALHAAAALVEQKARAAINPQPESERE